MTNLVSLLLRIFIGLVLVFASMAHFNNPFMFLGSFLRYQIFEFGVSSILLPWAMAIESVLGTALLASLWPRTTLKLCFLYFTVCGLAQISVFLRGIRTDCGCFGSFSQTIGPLTIAIPLALAGICAALVWIDRKNGDWATAAIG